MVYCILCSSLESAARILYWWKLNKWKAYDERSIRRIWVGDLLEFLYEEIEMKCVPSKVHNHIVQEFE